MANRYGLASAGSEPLTLAKLTASLAVNWSCVKAIQVLRFLIIEGMFF